MSKPTMFSNKKSRVVTYEDLNDHDKKAYRDFQRFLKCKAAGHWERMLKRNFWRKYLGLPAIERTNQ
jgi:hypothetical protein